MHLTIGLMPRHHWPNPETKSTQPTQNITIFHYLNIYVWLCDIISTVYSGVASLNITITLS